MSKEGEEVLQHNLFNYQPPELKPSPLPEEAFESTDSEELKLIEGHSSSTDQVGTELRAPAPGLREVKAVSSLLRNRLLLEVVERRIQKTSAIILSFLLTQEGLSAQIGPYLVWLAEGNKIEALKTLSDDDWQQLHFPEMKLNPDKGVGFPLG